MGTAQNIWGGSEKSLCGTVMMDTVMMHACSVASVMSDFVTLWTSPPDSSDHGMFQARILEWVTVPTFRGSS